MRCRKTAKWERKQAALGVWLAPFWPDAGSQVVPTSGQNGNRAQLFGATCAYLAWRAPCAI